MFKTITFVIMITFRAKKMYIPSLLDEYTFFDKITLFSGNRFFHPMKSVIFSDQGHKLVSRLTGNARFRIRTAVNIQHTPEDINIGSTEEIRVGQCNLAVVRGFFQHHEVTFHQFIALHQNREIALQPRNFFRKFLVILKDDFLDSFYIFAEK